MSSLLRTQDLSLKMMRQKAIRDFQEIHTIPCVPFNLQSNYWFIASNKLQRGKWKTSSDNNHITHKVCSPQVFDKSNTWYTKSCFIKEDQWSVTKALLLPTKLLWSFDQKAGTWLVMHVATIFTILFSKAS